MTARLSLAAMMPIVVAGALLIGTAGLRARVQTPRDSDGWTIPASAASESDPSPVTPATLAKGQQIFKDKCQHCHGATGTGNGPDADPDHPPGNLTDPRRASRNPDGVMFYKVWNGRSKPKMPAFKTELSREEIWQVIQYAKTLRRAG
jgi:mono/diheme cytochrome c family protein